MITAKMRRTGHSSYSITRDRGAREVADSGGPPAMGRWAGGASPPLSVFKSRLKAHFFDTHVANLGLPALPAPLALYRCCMTNITIISVKGSQAKCK